MNQKLSPEPKARVGLTGLAPLSRVAGSLKPAYAGGRLPGRVLTNRCPDNEIASQ